MVQYRWQLEWAHNIDVVHPIYKDDLSLEYKQETNQQFFRANLSSKITFVGDDADIIINAPFYTEFIIYIYKSNDNGQTWQLYFKGLFYKTDCTINEDDKNVTVQPSVLDNYKAILDGWEREYNILDKPLAVQPIVATKRPMLQMYVEGEDIVTCYAGGNVFEVDRVNDDVTPGDCHFDFSDQAWLIHFPNTTWLGLKDDFTGTFRGEYQTQPFDKFRNDYGFYYIEYFVEDRYEQGVTVYYNGLRIKDLISGSVKWQFIQSYPRFAQPIPSNITFTSTTDGTTINAELTYKIVFARIVCDVTQVIDEQQQTHNTYPIANNDIVANNRNYRYCIGVKITNIYQSTRFSSSPTKWGRANNGQYFLPPSGYQPFIPIGRSQWFNSSIWVDISDNMTYFDLRASKEYTIKDAYPLATVINTLLSYIAPDITFIEDWRGSDFFYNDDAIGVASYLNWTRPFISPKSNILLGEYREPAQKAVITLKSVFDMLARVYGCYWYITASKRLVIEHISWFKNGGSYNNTQQVGYDLTDLENAPNGKKWAYGTSQYNFDKFDMPARYQYEWMDDVTEMFKGQPINVLSPFVTRDKIEEVTIANFSSDIDLMLLAAEKFSRDGFALLQAEFLGTYFKLPFFTYTEGVYSYRLQNHILSMKCLQSHFLIYDMPSWSIEVDGVTTRAAGIKKLKKQTLTFPIGNNDPDLNKLVKTYIGNGHFDKLTINLSSRMAKVTLKYNTYDD